MPRDYYEILGLEKGAGEQQIKQAYRKLAFQYHPDRNQGNEAAAEKMKEINEAYAVLSHPTKRQEYDALRERFGAEAYAHFTGTHSPEDIVRESDIDQVFQEFARTFGFRNSDEIFAEFYGPGFRTFEFRRPGVSARGFVFTGSFGRSASAGDREVRPATPPPGAPLPGLSGKLLKFVLGKAGIQFPERGKDWRDTVSMRTEQAQMGCEIEYRYRKWGKPKDLMVKIPAGTPDRQLIKLTGMGAPGKGGGEPGDLYLRVRIKVPFFQRIRSLFK